MEYKIPSFFYFSIYWGKTKYNYAKTKNKGVQLVFVAPPS